MSVLEIHEPEALIYILYKMSQRSVVVSRGCLITSSYTALIWQRFIQHQDTFLCHWRKKSVRFYDLSLEFKLIIINSLLFGWRFFCRDSKRPSIKIKEMWDTKTKDVVFFWWYLTYSRGCKIDCSSSGWMVWKTDDTRPRDIQQDLYIYHIGSNTSLYFHPTVVWRRSQSNQVSWFLYLLLCSYNTTIKTFLFFLLFFSYFPANYSWF